MGHLRCDGVEQHPCGPADLFLRQGRQLRLLLLRIPSNTLLTRHIHPNEEKDKDARKTACLDGLRLRSWYGLRRGEREREERAEAVVVGAGVGRDDEPAGEGGHSLEDGCQRVGGARQRHRRGGARGRAFEWDAAPRGRKRDRAKAVDGWRSGRRAATAARREGKQNPCGFGAKCRGFGGDGGGPQRRGLGLAWFVPDSGGPAHRMPTSRSQSNGRDVVRFREPTGCGTEPHVPCAH